MATFGTDPEVYSHMGKEHQSFVDEADDVLANMDPLDDAPLARLDLADFEVELERELLRGWVPRGW
jgi:hypothetical protein